MKRVISWLWVLVISLIQITIALAEVNTSHDTQPFPSTPRAVTTARNHNGDLLLFALDADGRPMLARGAEASATWQPLGNNSPSRLLPVSSVVSVGQNLDGRLEAFLRGADSAIWHVAQLTVDGAWGAWASLGGICASGPTVIRHADNGLEVFVIGYDGNLAHRYQPGPNQSWLEWGPLNKPETLPGILRADPVAVTDANGDIYVFARALDESIRFLRQKNKAWQHWETLGGIVKGQISVAMHADGGLEVFAIGYDDRLAHNYQPKYDLAWSGWMRLGDTQFHSHMAVLRRADKGLELAAVGYDHQLWRLRQTPTAGGFPWGSWASSGGYWTSAIALGQTRDGQVYAVGRGGDRLVYEYGAGGQVGQIQLQGTVRLPSHDPNRDVQAGDVTTQRYNNARTGATLAEAALNTSSVSAHQFGALFRRALDGDVYAQPLYVANLTIPGKGTHDVVYVATSHDSVYAYDANDPAASEPLWRVSLGESAAMPNPDFGNQVPPKPDGLIWICDQYRRNHGYTDATAATWVPPDDLHRRVEMNHVWYNLREVGITSTPVIDMSTDTMYVVAFTAVPGSSTSSADCLDLRTCKFVVPCKGKQYRYELHALDIRTGKEKFGGPKALDASVPATTDDAVAGTLKFQATLHLQRPALLLSQTRGQKLITIAFGGFGDVGAYHGWVIVHDAATLTQVGAYTDTAVGSGQVGGGIWMSGQGPAADDSGNIYLATGNGNHTVTGSPGDASGNSVLRLIINSGATTGPVVMRADVFTPFHADDWLNPLDMDLGVSGPVLIPGTSLIMQSGKQGLIYLLKRDDLGGFREGVGKTDRIIEVFQAAWKDSQGSACGNMAHVHSAPVFWRGADGSHLFVWGEEDYLKSYRLDGDQVTKTGTKLCTQFYTGVVDSQSEQQAVVPGVSEMPGGILALSANGSVVGTAVVWVTRPSDGTTLQQVPHGILEAYDASNLKSRLWTSATLGDDELGRVARFTPPTVANGKVYVATFASKIVSGAPYSELVVYGLK